MALLGGDDEALLNTCDHFQHLTKILLWLSCNMCTKLEGIWKLKKPKIQELLHQNIAIYMAWYAWPNCLFH
jgi:hypothetical protein